MLHGKIKSIIAKVQNSKSEFLFQNGKAKSEFLEILGTKVSKIFIFNITKLELDQF